MQIRVFVALFMTALLLSQSLFGNSAMGQSSLEKIRLLREEIAKREVVDVPDDLKELHQLKLRERRVELNKLLKTEIDKLQKYKTALGSAITSEENEKILASVRAYESEAGQLSALLGNSAEESPSRSGTAETASTNGTAPASTVNTAATAPAPAPVPAPAPQQPTAFPLVSSNETLKTTASGLDCNAVNAPGGQDQAFSQLDITICGLVKDNLERRRSATSPVKILNINSTDFFNLVVIMIAKRQTPEYLVHAEEKRLDKQVGGAPTSPGSTSLVVKGGAPAILGFAVENGGLTRSIDGTAVTFRGNPVGLFNALKNRGFVPSVKADEDDPVLRFLKKTSFAFTFNTDRGPDPGVFTGTKQQLSSFSARIELINKRRPELYLREWENFLVEKAQPFANSLNAGTTQLTDASQGPVVQWRDPALQSWFAETNQALTNATDADVEAVIKSRLDKLPIGDLSPDTILQLNGIERELGVYLSGREELLNKINSGTVVTLEYLNKREVNAPDTSHFSFIAEKGTGGGKVDFTFNASLTMFNNLDALKSFVSLNPGLPPPRRLRDFQFAGQLDVPFGSTRDFGEFVLFAGGRYQRLLENATTDLGMVIPNTKGDIGYLQLGLKVPIKNTGFKIPFSVTFANRTELVKEQSIRGNFGFTLDLDTLFARFKPF